MAEVIIFPVTSDALARLKTKKDEEALQEFLRWVAKQFWPS